MHRLAVYFTRRLIENNLVDETNKEEYAYGLEILFGKILNYSTLLILAIIFNVIIPSIFFLITFFPLRERTGGFHAKTALRCYIGTVGIYVLLVMGIIPRMIGNLYLNIGILAISSVIIVAFAPINHPSLGLNREEVENCKKSSRILLLLVIACIGVAMVLDLDGKSIAYAVTGVGMDATLLIIAKTIKQEAKALED